MICFVFQKTQILNFALSRQKFCLHTAYMRERELALFLRLVIIDYVNVIGLLQTSLASSKLKQFHFFFCWAV